MPDHGLYDQDFVDWTRKQAAELRRLAELRANLTAGLDLENLAEEIESLGQRDRRAVISALARIVEHLLKLEYARADRPRAGWKHSVKKQRDRLRDVLDQSPSLRAEVPGLLPKALQRGHDYAADSLAAREPQAELPAEAGYTAGQVLDDWWPTNRFGLK
ncbi:MAG: DUF29 family protein [Alphaproteobacteria bacterium]|jgi:hypothetical protein|nr:DUF29 family protein [Alphaproteobacteria bacterium]